MPGETPANSSPYLLLSTMSGGTTLQPSILFPLCLVETTAYYLLYLLCSS
jgi:hypothetical protein